MGPLVDQLGNKVPGQLIRSEDWNDLVAAIEGIRAELTGRIDSLESSVDERFGVLDGRVTSLESLRDRVEPLLAEYFRVNLHTTALTYVLGQAAELRAEVRDLQGNPIEFADADRPWIDFVATWGRLGAVGGFETLGGAGDRSLSVRVNAAGEARVLLRAEVDDGDDDPGFDVSDTLTTTLTNGLTVSQAILTATTPAQAKSSGAFQHLSQQYDQPASIKVRSFVDAYYVQNAPKLTGHIVPPVTHRWRDYRSSVLAFAKGDADPLTPDQSRGASAIQVHFRDWIGPWLLLDYIEAGEIGKLVPFARDQFAAKVTGDLVQSTLLVRDAVKSAVRPSGLVGKLRDYQVVNEALDQLSVPEHAAVVPAVTKSIKQAVTVQQALEQSSAITVGTGESAALDALAETSVRADSNVAGVQSQLQTLEQTVGRVDKRIGSVQEKVGSLDGKVTTTLATTLQRLDSDVKTVSGKVEVLKELDPSNVRTKLVELDGIANRVSALERGLAVEVYLEPRDVPVADARKVLAFLNAAQSAEEIAATVEFPHERDVGLRVGQRLLDRRAQLGAFANLDQVAAVPQVGPERFTEIVVALAGVGVLVGSRVDEALRDRLRELEAAVAGLLRAAARPRVTLRVLEELPFVGEPVTLLVEAADAEGEPLVDAPLSVASTWGRLASADDPEREEGQALTLRTGIDGRAQLRLTPPSAEYLWDVQQAALETSLGLLDRKAETPRAAVQGLEELARQYRWEAASDLRHAVDVYFRDFRTREVENVNFRDRLDHWSYVDATITAVLVDGTSVDAGAVLTVRFTDWLGPWVDAYTALLEADAQLAKRLRDVGQANAKDPDRLLEGVQGQVREFVDRQRGLAGSYAGERVAEKSMLGFLEREVGQLPLDARLQLFPALQSGSQTIAHVGVGAFGAIAQTQVQLRREIRRRTGGLLDPGILDGRLQAFALEQDEKLGRLESQLNRKADTTEFAAFRGQVSSSIDDVRVRVSGLERGRG